MEVALAHGERTHRKRARDQGTEPMYGLDQAYECT